MLLYSHIGLYCKYKRLIANKKFLVYLSTVKYNIFQTDAEFSAYPQIRHGACFALAIFCPLSDIFHLPIGHQEFIDFYKKELSDNDTDIDNEMFIGNPQNYIDDLLGASGKVKYYGERPPTYSPAHGEIVWGCWHRDGTDFNHFTLTDGYGVCTYDPWILEGSASVAQGKLISVRVALIL